MMSTMREVSGSLIRVGSVSVNHMSAFSRSLSLSACPTLIGSSITNRSPRWPVAVPPTDVAMRKPVLVVAKLPADLCSGSSLTCGQFSWNQSLVTSARILRESRRDSASEYDAVRMRNVGSCTHTHAGNSTEVSMDFDRPGGMLIRSRRIFPS